MSVGASGNGSGFTSGDGDRSMGATTAGSGGGLGWRSFTGETGVVGDAVLGVKTTGGVKGRGLIGRKQREVTVTPDTVTLRISPARRASAEGDTDVSAARPGALCESVL